MALSIKNAETERLARELAQVTGESLTTAITRALRDRLVREAGRPDEAGLLQDVRRIQARVAAMPILDDRSPDEIIGYDDFGLPA